jgi:hypothetical protein
MNFEKFKEEHCCNKFCSYYGLEPFSSESETGRGDPISPGPLSKSNGSGNSFPKNPMGFDQAWKGKGKAKATVDIDDDDDDIVVVEHDHNAASTSAAGGYTKRMDLSP